MLLRTGNTAKTFAEEPNANLASVVAGITSTQWIWPCVSRKGPCVCCTCMPRAQAGMPAGFRTSAATAVRTNASSLGLDSSGVLARTCPISAVRFASGVAEATDAPAGCTSAAVFPSATLAASALRAAASDSAFAPGAVLQPAVTLASSSAI